MRPGRGGYRPEWKFFFTTHEIGTASGKTINWQAYLTDFGVKGETF